jgi:hypothetical protein
MIFSRPTTIGVEYNEINTTSDYTYNRYRYNICFISCCAFIIYFLLTVPTIFMDVIIGFMYRDIYTCPTCPVSIKLLNELSINNWLIVNGLMSYLNLMMLVLLNKVYTDNTFFRKLLKYSTYIITIFVLTWTVLGSIIFYKYYYNNVYADDLNNKCPFFYNYLFIRIVLAPLIVILRFVEIYNV